MCMSLPAKIVCCFVYTDCNPFTFSSRRSPCIGGVYVRCIHRIPGEVIVGDSGLCCCGPACNVMCDERNYAITSHCLWILFKML